jgi:hypothetical protein
MLGACALLLPSVDRGDHLVVEPWLGFFERRYNHLGGVESIELYALIRVWRRNRWDGFVMSSQ